MKNIYILIVGLLLIIIFPSIAFGQQNALWISNSYNGMSLHDFSLALEKDRGIRIFYNHDSIPDVTILIKGDSALLSDILKTSSNDPSLNISNDSEHNYFITKVVTIETTISPDVYMEAERNREQQDRSESPNGYIDTKNEFVPENLVIGQENGPTHAGRALFRGIVKDAKTGEPVIGATVYIEELKQGTVTNVDGRFELSVPTGNYTIQASSIDKLKHRYNLKVLSDGMATLTLQPKLVALEEVTISSDKFNKVRNTQMGLEHISAKDAKNIPVVMGEKDVLKVIQLLPGVQQSGEGASGFNVRGSPADQNLFYLNGIPVYNVNHLNGFFSAFHPEAIDEVNLYKSNIPVEYGGRLASIFDISTRKGSYKKFGMHGGISPVSSNILLDNPIVKDKGSIMVGARVSYINWLLKKVKDPAVRNSNADFSDMLASVNYDLTKKDKLSLFGYYSLDQMDYDQKIKHEYSNRGASLKWNHLISNKGNFTSALVYSRYEFNENNSELIYNAYQHSYFINQFEWKNYFTIYYGEKHTLIAGLDNTYYIQSRGRYSNLLNDSVVNTTQSGNENALESGLFVGDEWHLSDKISLYGGVRYNLYNYLGPQDVYLYNSSDLRAVNITDTVHYSGPKIIKSYQKPVFRLSAKYQLFPNLSAKISYNQLQQNIFMLSNTLSISPTDKWKLADYHIKPMQGNQYSFGLYYNTPGRIWELTGEVYYKSVKNFVEYKDGANMLTSQIPETEILQGNLTAYGAEFMIRKNLGSLTGWLNYSYTHSRVLIENNNPYEKVNNGIQFPSSYDKPHAINFVSNYTFSRRFSFSCNVVYSTGRPYTSPESVYFIDGTPVINYSARNEMRIPDYFRVDLSANLEGNLVKKKLAHGSWMFSVYNLLGRKNAYSVYFKSEEGRIKGYKLSIFGAPIYTATYIIKLGNYND